MINKISFYKIHKKIFILDYNSIIKLTLYPKKIEKNLDKAPKFI